MLHKLKRIDMEAKDLRIGNYVNPKNLAIVSPSFFIGLIGSNPVIPVEPIPLTEEWFDKLKVPQWFRAVIGGCDNSESYYINISFLPLGYLDIKYVHQLQNLYHALTGEELTIKK
jgi:hypothetical protein